MQIKPEMGAARTRLGIALRGLNRTSEAVTELREATKVAPRDAKVIDGLRR